jgi:hypothetical protein
MIKVWGRPTSIHTQRVLWALADADVPHELILASATMGPNGHVSKGAAPFGIVNTPSYRAMNPNGTVPTIDDDGFILWESNAILTWVALKYAPQVLFGGGDAQHLARAVQWMSSWAAWRRCLSMVRPTTDVADMKMLLGAEPKRNTGTSRQGEVCRWTVSGERLPPRRPRPR